MWSYHNDRLHDNAGVLASAKHAELDASISAEIALGPTGMISHTRHFLYVNLSTLNGCSVALKQQWLASVTLGRKAFAIDLQQAAPFFWEAAFIRS